MNINVTLFAQIIAFVLMIWFVNKVLWGPFTRLLGERQKRIADGLAAADKGKHDLERAEKRALEIIEEAKADARTQGDRLVEAAKAEIERESNRAREQLRGQVAVLAAAGASKIIGREIDRKAHDELLQDLASQI